MKKITSIFLLLSMFALTASLPTLAEASPLPVEAGEAEFADFYLADFYEPAESGELGTLAPCPRGTYRVRRSTRTKKKVINSLIAGGIGTAIGAGVGGKRGALIGAGSGAGGYLVYRYIRDRRGRCVRSYVRR